jgi:hypothetical protein
MKIFLLLFALTTITQSSDDPFQVTVQVKTGQTVYLSVHCNSPDVAHVCLSESPRDNSGNQFTIGKIAQSGSVQDVTYTLANSPIGKRTIDIVPNKDFHKIHQGWNYVVTAEAK